ncbi:MAG: DUF1365 domain-containing protein [Chryseolinea sp.]
MNNSCIYECTVMHHRLEPKDNKFSYKIFMFALDLEEIDEVAKKNLFISRNRFNIFNFRDKDHLQLPIEAPDTSKDVRVQILNYVSDHGVAREKVNRILLITNLCTLGYQFNPVSFYYCFDEGNNPLCCVVEVCNTYREMKTYFLGHETLSESRFNTIRTKNFYVSPFIDMDADFHFSLYVPGNKLNVSINDHKKGKRFLLTTLTGKRKSLNSANVFLYALRFPFITVQIITLIHWQALKLYFKKLRYHKKTSGIELQQDVLRPHKSIVQ